MVLLVFCEEAIVEPLDCPASVEVVVCVIV